METFVLVLLSAGLCLAANDIVWTTPVENELGAVPLGNGVVATSVWAAKANSSSSDVSQLVMYLSRNDAYDETGSFLKLGRLRLTFPRSSAPFRQVHSIEEASVRVTTGAWSALVWVDANADVVRINYNTSVTEQPVTATLELWREDQDQTLHSLGLLIGGQNCRDRPISLDRRFSHEDGAIGFSRRNYEASDTHCVDGYQAHYAAIGCNPDGPDCHQLSEMTCKSALTCVSEAAQACSSNASCAAFAVSTDAVSGGTRVEMYSSAVRIAHNHAWDTYVKQSGARACRPSFFEDTLARQNITLSAQERHDWDPFRNVSMGVVVTGAGGTPAWTVRDKTTLELAGAAQGALSVHVSTRVAASTDQFVSELKHTVASDARVPLEERWHAHLQHWSDFWRRSHIAVTSSSDSAAAAQVSQAYAHIRFLHAIQGKGGLNAYPIKFNGMQFTANTTGRGVLPGVNPDAARQWGGLFWHQNTRWPYHSMSVAGDSDLLDTWFRFYARIRPLNERQAQLQYGIANGAYYKETMTHFGTYGPAEYGWGCPTSQSPWHTDYATNPYVRFHWQGGIEMILLMLDDYETTGSPKTLEQHLLPFATSALHFYAMRFPHMLLSPTQALETWQCPNPSEHSQCVVNDTPTLAGLAHVLPRMLVLPLNATWEHARTEWQQMLVDLPALPITDSPTGATMAPAQATDGKTSNVENAELYFVHPYRLVTSSHGNASALAMAQRTYAQRRFKCSQGWCQDGPESALLGDAVGARADMLKRLAVKPPGGFWRYPVFLGPAQNTMPDGDTISVLKATLQLMLVQPLDDADGSVVLFAAWPRDWDVDFDVRAPRGTRIRGTCRNNTLGALTVEPSERTRFVHFTEGVCDRTK